jgi:HKD family nuclease
MKLHVLKPAEAPPGIDRLMPILQQSLAHDDYRACSIIVAFARLSGVARLLPQIRTWRGRKGRIEAIVGIDRYGTSREALQVLLQELDTVYITCSADQSCTFHPKMYLFEGPRTARAVVGSHNLTLGGLETNFEGGIVLDLELPAELAQWEPFRDAWNQLLPEKAIATKKLDHDTLEEVIADGRVLPESRISRRPSPDIARDVIPVDVKADTFPVVPPAPPSPLPKDVIPGRRRRPARKAPGPRPTAIERQATVEELPRALVIEVIPHQNGEIFLSKTAADAFPRFFGMPFTGRTTPKVARNPAYPMRIPDPVVEWRLYDEKGSLIHRSQFGLNTVLYEKKSEIRITVSPSLAKLIPKYSVMVMWGGSSPIPLGLEYLIDVHVPGSPGHEKWVSAMNMTLPGGGLQKPRRMGWI